MQAGVVANFQSDQLYFLRKMLFIQRPTPLDWAVAKKIKHLFFRRALKKAVVCQIALESMNHWPFQLEQHIQWYTITYFNIELLHLSKHDDDAYHDDDDEYDHDYDDNYDHHDDIYTCNQPKLAGWAWLGFHFVRTMFLPESPPVCHH